VIRELPSLKMKLEESD